MTDTPSTRRPRVPRLVVAAWSVTGLALAVLAVAVVRYLAEGGSDGHGMAGMSGMPGMTGMTSMSGMSTADALTRAGGSELLTRPLWGPALVTAWHLDAVALAVLLVLAALYVTGVALVPARSPGQRWPVRRTAAFFAGLAVAGFATNGSIAVYDQVLFSAHMAGHLALVMVAPALLVCGRPLALALAAAPERRRARLARVFRGRTVALLTAPPVTLATYAVVIVGSHLTGLMNVIMRNTWAGQAEHLVYLVAGFQFFLLIVGDEPIRWRLGSPARWLLLALAMAVDTFTGVVLMQNTRAVGMAHAGFPVNTLSDTRTGGAIMWFGGDAIMAAIMIALVVGWLRTVDIRPAERGWLEQARSATFEAHTGADDGESIDSDDDAREAYNQWLERINR